jgi:hypothetical protein
MQVKICRVANLEENPSKEKNREKEITLRKCYKILKNMSVY